MFILKEFDAQILSLVLCENELAGVGWVECEYLLIAIGRASSSFNSPPPHIMCFLALIPLYLTQLEYN